MHEPILIEHQGIIKKIKGNELTVSILSKAACLSCSLKSACSISEIEEKTIDIITAEASKYTLYENVYVYYKQSLGFRALFLGYLLPFLIVMTTLITIIIITDKEGLAGILSLASLAPYYIILYFTKRNLKKTFSFSIRKSTETFPNIEKIDFSK